jgi:hypothetical protein
MSPARLAWIRRLLVIGVAIGTGQIVEHLWPSPVWINVVYTAVCVVGVFVVDLIMAARTMNQGDDSLSARR